MLGCICIIFYILGMLALITVCTVVLTLGIGLKETLIFMICVLAFSFFEGLKE